MTSTSNIFCSSASAFDLLLQTFLGVRHNFGAEDDDGDDEAGKDAVVYEYISGLVKGLEMQYFALEACSLA